MSQTVRIAALLFGSGFCALVYQLAWLREFRLIFGASTSASAAVLAIFIGGLGAGGLLIGRWVDRQARPLWLYAQLEIAIAVSAALTPALLWLVRSAYVAWGGTLRLGDIGGTIVRLLLTALVLALPTWLMGGTLPAAARAATPDADRRRGSLALLYGVNTLGAVSGAFVATFFMLELFGTQRTLWLACLLNLLVAVLARQLARGLPDQDPSPAAAPSLAADAPAGFVLFAAGAVGFAFFLMELVWYRMLSPILGGSIFTFGLILTIALLGIGLGGWAYSLRNHSRPATLLGFAYTCLLEAACLAVPYVLADRLAVLAMLLRPFGNVALFWGHVASWTLVCGVVVLPAAFVAGYQFPLLVGLLGQGRQGLGRQIGLAYACNTLGAVLGSLAGGFGLLPFLSAPGAWRGTGLGLATLGLIAVSLSLRRPTVGRRALAPAALALLVVAVFVLSDGPSAAWRHSAIGAGRAPRAFHTPNQLEDWIRLQRSSVNWEADGVESSVALVDKSPGYALIINGKNDGSCRGNAATMIMSGLLGALLHPAPRIGLVIGLGTGTTAGWMAAVPDMNRVDVVELERLVTDVATDCAAVNHNVMSSPKVNVTIGDARETLLVSREQYDLIFSQPSNPYRAGVASLFTREFYEAVARRLKADGIFLQWVQAYEVDATAIETIYATLASVFPEVHTWQVSERDLMLLTSKSALAYDAIRIRERLHQEPYASGVRIGWDVTDLEGLLAWFVARSSLAQAVRQAAHTTTNTDDRNVIEFGFARSVGRFDMFNLNHLREAAWRRQEDRPELRGASVDWQRVLDNRISFHGSLPPRMQAQFSPRQRRQAVALAHWRAGDLSRGLAAWRSLDREPQNLTELRFLASALADVVDADALDYIARLRAHEALEGSAILAHLRFREGRPDQAAAELIGFFSGFRRNPWPDPRLAQAAVVLAVDVAQAHRAAALPLYEALSEPFAVHAANQLRLDAMRRILALLGPDDFLPRCQALVQSLEPHVPWQREWLELRTHCYKLTNSPDAVRAAADLEQFLRRAPAPFGRRLPVRGDPGRSGPD